MQRIIYLLLIGVTCAYARYVVDDGGDPNGIREEVADPSQRIVTTPIDDNYADPEPELDSCDDYPPNSCIAHFHPLPRYLHRSPFNLRNPYEFDLVCGSYRKALPCAAQWVGNCHSSEPDARTFIDNMSQLLNQCDNEQVRKDSIVALECGRRMGSIHDRCIRETRFIDRLKDLTPENLVRGRSNLADLCCGIRYHKACFMDHVQERCGTEAFEANKRLEEIILSGFNCDAYPESQCTYNKPR